MKPVMSTKWTFECTAPLGFGEVHNDELRIDSAISDDYDKARKIILDCYGHNLGRFLKLIKKEPILLYDPKPNYAFEIKTLRFSGPRKDRNDYEG